MKLPDFSFEKRFQKAGYKVVAGIDEVGRGSFAGPVVAAVVVFPPGIRIPRDITIDDSKKLSAKRRKIASMWIKENSLTWSIGEVPASLINRIGMAKATKTAFRRAITNTTKILRYKDTKIQRKKSPNIQISQYLNIFLLIDAFYIPFVRGIRRKNQLAIINGDEKCFSIAAASIIAKVYRDQLMLKLGLNPKYKKYAWGSNKGYGTRKHREAIEKYGITRYHRKQFVSKLKS